MRLSEINFRIGDRVRPDIDEMPSDPLDEFPPIDTAIRMFCHFENRDVVMVSDGVEILIGDTRALFTFELDLGVHFFYWIKSYRKLMLRQSDHITFPERCWLIRWTHADSHALKVVFETFGDSISKEDFLCDHMQFSAALGGFLEAVARRGHEARYLDDAQLNELLAKIA